MKRAISALLSLGLISGLSAQDDKPKKPDAEKQAPAAKAKPKPKVLIKTSMGDITVELFINECPKTVANFIGLAEGSKEFNDSRTAKNVKRPFYDGLIFHRVIKNFMAQGGCPMGVGSGNPGFKFEDEINATALGLHKMKAVSFGPDGKIKGPHPSLLIRSQQQFRRQVLGPVFKKLGITSQVEFDQKKKEFDAALKALTLKQVYEGMGYKYNDSRGSHRMLRGTLAMANSGPNTNGSQFFINMKDNEYLNGKHTVFGRVLKGMDVVDKMQTVEMGPGDKPKTDIKIVSIRRLDAQNDK